MAGRGVASFEGEWEEDLRSRMTTRPLMDLLRDSAGADLDVIHRDVATPEELAFYVGRLKLAKYKHMQLVYLAFHGNRGSLQLGSTRLSLEELADCLGKTCAGKVIHLASCSVMHLGEGRLRGFLEATGATALSGYRRQVDWVPSVAFELLLIEALQRGSPRSALARLDEDAAPLVSRLGWRYLTPAP